MNLKKNAVNILILVIVVVAVTVGTAVTGGGGVTLDFTDNGFTVSGPEEFSRAVDYDRIASLELVDLANLGSPASGGETRSCYWGSWESAAWGAYDICALKQVDNAILLTTRDGERLIFNCESEDTTGAMLQAIAQMCTQPGEEAS